MNDAAKKALTLGNFINENQLTYNQVDDIYKALSTEDKTSTEVLASAKEETENTEYDTIGEIDIGENTIPGVTENIEVSTKDLNEVLKEYDINSSEAENMIGIIDDYKAHKNCNYYNRLPESFKKIADGIRQLGVKEGTSVSKNSAAMILLGEIIHDSQFVNAMNELESEINTLSNEINKEYNQIFTDAFNDVFSKIDEIEIENPEKAEQIRKIKAAFEDSSTFEKQMEYAKKIGVNKLTKLANRFDNEAIYFNTKVNVTNVKVPDVRELLQIIHINLPQFEIIDIKKFIIIICKSTIDINVEKDLPGLAYIYKLINNIYIYKFLDNLKDNEAATLLFGKIAEVLEYIANKK